MATMRAILWTAISLLLFYDAASAQDRFDSGATGSIPSMSAEQARRCAEERLKHYADEPFKQPSVCPQPGPTPGTGGGVLLRGGVSVEQARPQGGAGIFEGGSLPSPGGSGVFGEPGPIGPVLQGGTGTSTSGASGGVPTLSGEVSQGQQGTTEYPRPTALTPGVQPVFVGSVVLHNRNYTVRSEGPPGGPGWGPFENPGREYEGFYGQVEPKGSGYIFRITALRLPGGATQTTNIEVPVRRIR